MTKYHSTINYLDLAYPKSESNHIKSVAPPRRAAWSACRSKVRETDGHPNCKFVSTIGAHEAMSGPPLKKADGHVQCRERGMWAKERTRSRGSALRAGWSLWRPAR